MDVNVLVVAHKRNLSLDNVYRIFSLRKCFIDVPADILVLDKLENRGDCCQLVQDIMTGDGIQEV